MTMPRTLLAAAVLFALAACQPNDINQANAAQPLVQEDPPPPDQDPDDRDDGDDDADENGDDNDGEEDSDADDVASSPAEVTEHADAAATDALLDTREGGNPLVQSPLPPVDPVAESDEDGDDDDER